MEWTFRSGRSLLPGTTLEKTCLVRIKPGLQCPHRRNPPRRGCKEYSQVLSLVSILPPHHGPRGFKRRFNILNPPLMCVCLH